jgi:PAS domain S-box-containing protein
MGVRITPGRGLPGLTSRGEREGCGRLRGLGIDRNVRADDRLGMARPLVLLSLMMLAVVLADDGVRALTGEAWSPHWLHVTLKLLALSVFVVWVLVPWLGGASVRRDAERLAEAARTAELGLWSWEPRADHLEFDAVSSEQLGLHPGLRYGQDELVACVWRQDRERLRSAMERCLRDVETVTAEFRVEDGGGRVRWLYTALTGERDRLGRVLRVSGVSWDITARRQAEIESEQNRHIFESMGRIARIGGWRLNLDPPEPIWSDVVRQIHGAPEGYVPRLETALDFYAPEARPVIEEAVRRAIERGESWDLELPLIRYRGQRIWVRTIGIPQFEGGVCTHILGAFQDITDQHRATERLRTSEQRLDLAITSSRQGLWDWNVERGTTFFSNAWYSMLGYQPGELPMTVETWQRLLHPEDMEKAKAALNAHFSGEAENYRCELRMQRKDGGWHWVLAAGRVVERDGEARPVRVIGVHVDIDEAKRAEQRLRASEQRLELALNGAKLGLWDWQVQTGQTYFSDTWYTMLGYKPGELAMSLSTWEELTHPDDLHEAYERVNAHLRGETDQYRCEMRMRTKGGGWRWILDVGEVVDRNASGKPVRMTGVHVDIEQQKQAQARVESMRQRLRSFVENTPAAVAMLDRDMRYLVVSSGWYEQYGLPDEDITGRTHYEVFPDVPDRWREIHRRCLAGETLSCDRDPFERDNGATVWVRWLMRPWHDADGGIGGVIMVTEVINEQIAYERALSDARDQAERASRAKSEFLANMSHEIRTPMTAILGFAELLDDEAASSAQRADAVRTIRRNADHLLAVINDVLDISKIEAGRMTVECLNVSPGEVLRDVRDLMRARAEEKGLSLELEPGELPETIQTDPTRLRQILANLVGNAIKFTATGTVRVESVWRPEDPGVLRVLVSDTGIGMTQDQIERVFEAFTQADDSMTRRYGGTGLGLKISRELAHLLGGGLVVQSVPGAGSTFTLTIATGDLNRGVGDGAGGASDEGELGERPLAGCRVLLAEDGVDNQRLILFHLRKAGAEVTLAQHGGEALEVWDGGGVFDVVVMDMQMPEVDGYQAAWGLRRRGWKGAIIALTAHAMEGDRERCLEAGCSDYATKPIDREALIRACLRGWKGEDPGRVAA